MDEIAEVRAKISAVETEISEVVDEIKEYRTMLRRPDIPQATTDNLEFLFRGDSLPKCLDPVEHSFERLQYRQTRFTNYSDVR